MGVLKGKEFMAVDLDTSGLLAAIYNEASKKALDSYEYEPQAGDDVYRRALISIASLKVDVNDRIAEDANSNATPPVYREGTGLWASVDQLASLFPTSSVLAAVKRLPQSTGTGVGSFVRPAMVLGGLAVVLAAGYHLTRR